MLVEKMTKDDILKELIGDYYESLSNKEIGLELKYKRYFAKNKNKDGLLGIHYYKTNRLNKWFIIVFAKQNIMTYGYVCVKTSPYGETCYALSNHSLGMSEFTPYNIYVSEFTPHFFDRYKERVCKDYKGNIIEYFFTKNYFGAMYSDYSKGGNHVFLANHEGYALGYFDNIRYFKYNTFISTEMVKEKQFSEYPDLEKNQYILEKILEYFCKHQGKL